MMIRSLSLMTASAMLAAVPVVAEAEVLVHYRFGDDGAVTADSSGNGFDLTEVTSNEAGEDELAAYPLPLTGAGSSFPTVIPQTGQANASAATFGGQGNFTVDDPFTAGNGNVLQDFTVEAYFNQSGRVAGTSYIASQYTAVGNQRSWALGIGGTNGVGDIAEEGEVFVTISGNGTAATVYGSGVVLDLDDDYYLAFIYDSTTGDATVAIQNLTDGGSLDTSAVIDTPLTTVFDSTFALKVGGYNEDESRFIGIIDEVRISSEALATSELLTTVVPEPASLALLALGSGALAFRRRTA